MIEYKTAMVVFIKILLFIRAITIIKFMGQILKVIGSCVSFDTFLSYERTYDFHPTPRKKTSWTINAIGRPFTQSHYVIFITGQTRVKEASIRYGVFSVVSNGVRLTRGLSEGSWKHMSERKNINSLIILVPWERQSLFCKIIQKSSFRSPLG